MGGAQVLGLGDSSSTILLGFVCEVDTVCPVGYYCPANTNDTVLCCVQLGRTCRVVGDDGMVYAYASCALCIVVCM